MSKSILTPEQRAAAKALRKCRPPVIPGTRVVANEGLRSIWYDKVILTMMYVGIHEHREINVFCDLAGVPD